MTRPRYWRTAIYVASFTTSEVALFIAQGGHL